MRTRIALLAAVALAGCATEKIAATEALGPVLTVHTLPEGSEVLRDGKSLGKAPIDIPIRREDKEFKLEARREGFLPAKVLIEAPGLRKQGGGESMIALKPESMGTDTPDIDANRATDLDRGGVALSKQKRCAEAEPYFARALQLDPGFAKAHKDRARCLMQLKQYDRAATELEAYLTSAELAPAEKQKVTEQIAKLRGQRDIDLGGGETAGR